jgi:DNA-binding transcriptional regulator YiaG
MLCLFRAKVHFAACTHAIKKHKHEIIQSLIARRNELSISQPQLARMIGMQQPAICRLGAVN